MAESEAEILWWGPTVASQPEQQRGPVTANTRTQTGAEWGESTIKICT